LLTKGTVLVVKTQKLPKPEGDFLYVDKSLVYKKEEPARVVRVIHTKNIEGEDSVTIIWRTFRPVSVGDKLSSRSGNKGIVSRLMPRCDMPFTADGFIPDAVVNGHSFPTRMAVNQIIECTLGLHSAVKGTLRDATAFRKLDIDGVIKELDGWGIKHGGHTRMFNGFTGEWIDCLLFIGPTTYQRLAKFADDEYYAIERGATQPMTRQPLDGKSHSGGLRMGEMEKDVYAAHGVMRALDEKFRKDSDGNNIFICRSCGNRAIVGIDKNIVKCLYCQDPDIYSVPSTWCANLFINTITAMGVKTNFEIE
jgi:DNA-directed RNA polymerase II subunit RPB2